MTLVIESIDITCCLQLQLRVHISLDDKISLFYPRNPNPKPNPNAELIPSKGSMTANGPPPTTLVFLNQLPSLRPGSKVRFLGW